MVFMTTAAASRTAASGDSKAGVKAAMDSEVLSDFLLLRGDGVMSALAGLLASKDLAADDDVDKAGVVGDPNLPEGPKLGVEGVPGIAQSGARVACLASR